MLNFEIDGFIEKRGLYNENMIDVNDPDYIFYSSGHLLNSIYSCKEVKGAFYEYFENENLIKYEVNDAVSKKQIKEKIMQEQFTKVNLLQKKIRLLTGFGITLPIFKTMIYDENNNFFSYVAGINWEMSVLKAEDYNNDMKNKLSQRLHLYIADSTVSNLENKNIRYKRALNFYLKSFESMDIGVRFILLFSSLESLFNLTGKNVTKEITKYASKILFLDSSQENNSKWNLKTYYNIRSNYIHGNGKYILNEHIENNLREYVREILLIYWNISVVYNITNANKMKVLINNTNMNNLDLQVQLFVKYLRTPPKHYRKLYNQIRSEFLNKNNFILSNKKIM